MSTTILSAANDTNYCSHTMCEGSNDPNYFVAKKTKLCIRCIKYVGIDRLCEQKRIGNKCSGCGGESETEICKKCFYS